MVKTASPKTSPVLNAYEILEFALNSAKDELAQENSLKALTEVVAKIPVLSRFNHDLTKTSRSVAHEGDVVGFKVKRICAISATCSVELTVTFIGEAVEHMLEVTARLIETQRTLQPGDLESENICVTYQRVKGVALNTLGLNDPAEQVNMALRETLHFVIDALAQKAREIFGSEAPTSVLQQLALKAIVPEQEWNSFVL